MNVALREMLEEAGSRRAFAPPYRPVLWLPEAPAHGPIVTPKDWSAGDRSIAEYFWTSTGKSELAWTCPESEVRRVINFGMKAMPVPHGTPTGHGHLTVFVERIPLPIAEQMLRHRVQEQTPDGDAMGWVEWMPNISKTSFRYVEAGSGSVTVATDDELGTIFYIPAVGDLRSQVGRPGHYTYQPLSPVRSVEALVRLTRVYRVAWREYKALRRIGLASEQARFALSTGLYTNMYATASYRNWFNWLVQRNDSHAQGEIQQVAEQVESLMQQLAPITYELWNEHGRRVI